MSAKRFTLDTEQSESISKQAGGTEQLGFELSRLVDGSRGGVQLLTVRCGTKEVQIVPTRGMGIWQATNSGTRFGWDSPVKGPVHPSWVPIFEPSGLGWLEGFDEMMVRCGLENNGAPDFSETGKLIRPLHGRIANLPASDVFVEIDDAAGRISVTGTVNESRFHFHRWELKTTISLQVDSPEIEIVDTVTNLSDRSGSFQMLYHNNFGPPVLEQGSTIHAPAKRIAPRDDQAAQRIASWDQLLAPDPAFSEEVYFLDLVANSDGYSKVLLANADQSLAASIRFQTRTMPFFTLWKNTVGLSDGYVCGLEPGTNLPNPRSHEEQRGRVVEVEPGQTVELRLSIGMLIGSTSVHSAIDEINSLAAGEPELHASPLPQWSGVNSGE